MKRYILLFITCFSVSVAVQAIRPSYQLNSTANPSLLLTATASPVSLFAGDSCEPPCWYGLNAGLSTAEDVALFVQNADQTVFCCWDTGNGSEFDARTGYIRNGAHFFYWRDFARPDDYQTNSGLTIYEGMLDSMWILMKGIVPLKEVLEKLGQPDRIRYDNLFIKPHLVLDYIDIPLRVTITGEQLCTMRDIAVNFWVNSVEYYSPRYIEEFKWSAGYGDPQLPDVPADVWEAWLNGGDDTPCTEVVRKLQALPTLTPTPAATSTFIPARDLDLFPMIESLMTTAKQDCTLPCWWGFTPGETTLEEIAGFLRETGFDRHQQYTIYSTLSLEDYGSTTLNGGEGGKREGS